MEMHLHTLSEAQHVELIKAFEKLAEKFDKNYTEKKLHGDTEIPIDL